MKNVVVILKNEDEILKMEVEVFVNKKINEISYVEKDKDKTFVSFDYMNNILKRDNNKLYMEFDFLNEKGYFLLKEFNKRVDVSLQVENIEKSSESVSIKYYSDDKYYEYLLLKK